MSAGPDDPRHRITTLNEGPLHASLKHWYAEPDDRLEVPVDGFLVDIVRGELLIEIQTANVSAIRGKLRQLSATHRVRLVYPIAREKWIVRLPQEGEEPLGRRKSPRRGAVEDIFGELVSLPRLMARPGFSLEVVLIREEEVRRYDPDRAWRRRHWVTEERRLLDVLETRLFGAPSDLCALMPETLGEPFTTADLAEALERPRWQAQQMTYCLREMGAVEQVGRERRGILYVRRRRIRQA